VFRGTTFGDLRRKGPKPHLLVTATDLTTGGPFEFTPEQFSLICSDLDSVPLSHAVAASAAVPILLSPITLRNYAGSCPDSAPMHEGPPAQGNLSARLLHLIAQSYRDASERPYIHLVDGGMVDNLGVRSLIERVIAGGSLETSFGARAPGSVQKIVLISVNSERDTAERIDTSDRVPSVGQVVDALVFGAGSRVTTETTEMVNDVARRLTAQLRAERSRPLRARRRDARDQRQPARTARPRGAAHAHERTHRVHDPAHSGSQAADGWPPGVAGVAGVSAAASQSGRAAGSGTFALAITAVTCGPLHDREEHARKSAALLERPFPRRQRLHRVEPGGRASARHARGL